MAKKSKQAKQGTHHELGKILLLAFVAAFVVAGIALNQQASLTGAYHLPGGAADSQYASLLSVEPVFLDSISVQGNFTLQNVYALRYRLGGSAANTSLKFGFPRYSPEYYTETAYVVLTNSSGGLMPGTIIYLNSSSVYQVAEFGNALYDAPNYFYGEAFLNIYRLTNNAPSPCIQTWIGIKLNHGSRAFVPSGILASLDEFTSKEFVGTWLIRWKPVGDRFTSAEVYYRRANLRVPQAPRAVSVGYRSVADSTFESRSRIGAVGLRYVYDALYPLGERCAR